MTYVLRAQVDRSLRCGEDGETMTDETYRDWTITLNFTVPAGDTDGVFTEALFDAAIAQAPADAAGITARADTAQGKVSIMFTLVESSRELAEEVASSMRDRVQNAVLSGDDTCVSAS